MSRSTSVVAVQTQVSARDVDAEQVKTWVQQHFGAPHLCHIDHKDGGFVPRFIAS